MTIPDEAVEAGARALLNARGAQSWADVDIQEAAEAVAEAALVLEAAAPHMGAAE